MHLCRLVKKVPDKLENQNGKFAEIEYEESLNKNEQILEIDIEKHKGFYLLKNAFEEFG